MIFLPDGTMFVGTFGRGAWRVGNGCAQQLVGPGGTIPSHRISRILRDGSSLVFATAGEGLLLFDLGSSEWRRFDPSPDARMQYLHALMRTEAGELVVGSVGSGVALLRNGSWTYIDSGAGLTENWINEAAETPQGILIATARGVFQIIGNRAKLRFFPTGNWEDPEINTLLEASGSLFLGTVGDGVVVVPGSGKPGKVDGCRGAIHMIVPWKSGIWAAGDAGLWTLRADESSWTASLASGPWGTDARFKSLAVSPEGRLFGGTMDGRIFRSNPDGGFDLFGAFDGIKFKVEREEGK